MTKDFALFFLKCFVTQNIGYVSQSAKQFFDIEKGEINMIFDRVESDEERLKNVLISDKQFSPERLKKVMRSDVYAMLSNYCEITPKDFDINVDLQNDGTYKIGIIATCNRLKIFGSLPEEY